MAVEQNISYLSKVGLIETHIQSFTLFCNFGRNFKNYIAKSGYDLQQPPEKGSMPKCGKHVHLFSIAMSVYQHMFL